MGDAPLEHATLREQAQRRRRRVGRADDQRQARLRRARLVALVAHGPPRARAERRRERAQRKGPARRAGQHGLGARVRQARPHAARADGLQRRAVGLPLPSGRRRQLLRRRALPRVLGRGPHAALGDRRQVQPPRTTRDGALQVLQRLGLPRRDARRRRRPRLVRLEERQALGRHARPALPRGRLRRLGQVPRALGVRRTGQALRLRDEHLRTPHAHLGLRRLRRARPGPQGGRRARGAGQVGAGRGEQTIRGAPRGDGALADVLLHRVAVLGCTRPRTPRVGAALVSSSVGGGGWGTRARISAGDRHTLCAILFTHCAAGSLWPPRSRSKAFSLGESGHSAITRRLVS
mmetsp:Transcript_7803/g.32254  ORF Transcript_7803/g.32254 Transcript_7803/m.32254 type:complete len:349 (+) Transcript_7803:440-1486(+)